MSHSQTIPSPSASDSRGHDAPRRPGTLLALLLATALAALSGTVGAVLVFAGGTSMAATNIHDVVADHPDVVRVPAGTSAADLKALSGALWNDLVDDRYGTLSARAGFAIFFAAVLLVLLVFARKAALWARVTLTIALLGSLIPHFLISTDYEPASVSACSVAAILLACAAVVLCWLPGNQRYGREVKAARG